jgi:hypothetical protein
VVKGFLEVGDGMGLGGVTDFWVDSGDESDEVFIGFEFFSGIGNGLAVKEIGKDTAVSERGRGEEVLGLGGEGGGKEFFWLAFVLVDLAEILGELEIIWHGWRWEFGTMDGKESIITLGAAALELNFLGEEFW